MEGIKVKYKQVNRETHVPRSKDPNSFGDLWANLLIEMSSWPRSVKLEHPKPEAMRLEFYAYRRAWKAQSDQSYRAKQMEIYVQARTNYDVLARYQCHVFTTQDGHGIVEWKHVSMVQGTLIVSEERAENLPALASPKLDDFLETKSEQGVTLDKLFNDGRTPKTVSAQWRALRAAATTYGMEKEKDKAIKEFESFEKNHPEARILVEQEDREAEARADVVRAEREAKAKKLENMPLHALIGGLDEDEI